MVNHEQHRAYCFSVLLQALANTAGGGAKMPSEKRSFEVEGWGAGHKVQAGGAQDVRGYTQRGHGQDGARQRAAPINSRAATSGRSLSVMWRRAAWTCRTVTLSSTWSCPAMPPTTPTAPAAPAGPAGAAPRHNRPPPAAPNWNLQIF